MIDQCTIAVESQLDFDGIEARSVSDEFLASEVGVFSPDLGELDA